MSGFDAIGFTHPALLLALIALPILWWLLRAVPPAPVRRRFPGIALLLGLRERDPESQRTPWWLLAIRVLALGAFITALAGPVLNPLRSLPGQGPLLIVMDASWASARDWPRRIERVSQALDGAQRTGRTVAVTLLTGGQDSDQALEFHAADHWRERLAGFSPRPWTPQEASGPWVETLPDGTETLWISDGLHRTGRAELTAALQALGPVQVFEPRTPIWAVMPATFGDDAISVELRRGGDVTGAPEQELSLIAIGRDPAGVERELAREALTLDASARSAVAQFTLQPELRNRITRFQLDGARGAGAVSLADDSLRRRKVALLSVREGSESLALLSPLHYLRQALSPTTDLIESASLDDLLLSAPDVIVLADLPGLSEAETQSLTDWLEQGGLLLRFAGPRLAGAGFGAQNAALGAGVEDPLLPVALRAGGRTVGGAMSWGDPRSLAPFAPNSPFVGLDVPADVGITAQVLAQPGPDLSDRTIASLSDGTPLVTRATRGAGQVVLFHVTANAEWSNLPLSGLFVQMLERLAVSTRTARPEAGELAGTHWQPVELLDAFGQLTRADDRPAVAGEDLAAVIAGDMPTGRAFVPGLYEGTGMRLAVNAVHPEMSLEAAEWPLGIGVETGVERRETPLAGYVFAAALALLALDALATLALGGLLLRAAMIALIAGLGFASAPAPSMAQSENAAPPDLRIFEATEFVTLGLVPSGDEAVDEVAIAGLQGLSNALFLRTSVEPTIPVAIDIERDELAIFPLLYWPVTAESALPSAQAAARLNRYLRSGGMIVFDTRDADTARLTGGLTASARRLRQIAAGLDIPALEPVPEDHVLTRSFYLLNDFPGRYRGGDVWVEAAPPGVERAEGMPFRNLNDGVTPVVIGANDWASAWAVDRRGEPLVPIGQGNSGARQREIALRFGINLVLHVLSGNYKSDQVHVPALLERLGQ